MQAETGCCGCFKTPLGNKKKRNKDLFKPIENAQF